MAIGPTRVVAPNSICCRAQEGTLCTVHLPTYAPVDRRCSLDEESSEPVNAVEGPENEARASLSLSG